MRLLILKTTTLKPFLYDKPVVNKDSFLNLLYIQKSRKKVLRQTPRDANIVARQTSDLGLNKVGLKYWNTLAVLIAFAMRLRLLLL